MGSHPKVLFTQDPTRFERANKNADTVRGRRVTGEVLKEVKRSRELDIGARSTDLIKIKR